MLVIVRTLTSPKALASVHISPFADNVEAAEVRSSGRTTATAHADAAYEMVNYLQIEKTGWKDRRSL